MAKINGGDPNYLRGPIMGAYPPEAGGWGISKVESCLPQMPPKPRPDLDSQDMTLHPSK